MESKVLSSFQDGAFNVIKMMCLATPEPGKPLINKGRIPTSGVSGIISIISPERKGYMLLAFSEKAILMLVSRMLYEEKTEINDEIKDAVGELTNMIAGNSRSNLQKHGLVFEAGLPETIIGDNSKFYSHIPEDAQFFEIPFTVEKEHSFSLILAFMPGFSSSET